MLRGSDSKSDAIRFLIAGAVNNAISLTVYEIALFVAMPSIAYALAWAAGIIFVMVVYPDRVFPGGRRGAFDRAALAAGYALTLAIGLGLLQVFILVTGETHFAFLATLVVTTATNFLLSRAILRRGRPAA